MDKIIDDLNARGAKVVAFIVETEAGDVQLLEYDKKGFLTYISRPVRLMGINERLTGNMVKNICDVGGKR